MDYSVSSLFINFSVIIVLLSLSAFFSASESAFFSLDKISLLRLRQKNTKSSKLVLKLLEDTKKLLTVILVGNNIVNIFLAAYITLLTKKIFGEINNEQIIFIIEFIGVTILLLLFGEVTPKTFAVHNCEKFSEFSAPIIFSIYKGLMPIWIIFYKISQLLDIFFKKRDSSHFTEEEVKVMIQVGLENGIVDSEENKMISSIFKFSDTLVKEIMVSRLDMVAFDINEDFEDLLKLIKEQPFSRIPIYNNQIDNIVGVLYVKDLLLNLKLKKIKGEDYRTLIKPAYFVPGNRKIKDLLKDLQAKKKHMAIVVDEHGGVMGLITMEDILEEIVGDILDEYDKEEVLIKKVDNNIYWVEAKVNIDELNKVLDTSIETEEATTLGGFIFEQLGHVPLSEEIINYKNLEIKVKPAVKNRIKKVVIKKKNTEEKDNNE